MWHKLHAKFLCQLSSFKKSHVISKKIFDSMFKMFKEDKISNDIYKKNRHECKHYEEFDTSWHQTSCMMKHVFAIAYVPKLGGDDEKLVESEVKESSNLNPSKNTLEKSTTKSKFHEETLVLFSKMVNHNQSLVKSFQA